MRDYRFRLTAPAAVLISAVFAASAAFAEEEEAEAVVELTPVQEFMATMNLVDGLGVYNTQLETLLQDQRDEVAEIQNSLDNITMMRRQLGPLTERMVLSLEQFIELDLPFKLEERRGVIAELKDLLQRVDITTAEKFRRVMDAYQTEIEYGTSREAYTAFIEIEGRGRQVDMLRMGRTVLAFQTLDGNVTGVWDRDASTWVVLGSEYADGVRDALRMARATMTNDLSPVPIPAPKQGGQ